MRKTITSLFFVLLAVSILAQIPSGYYNTAVGKTEAALKTALFNKISAHTSRTYNQLWTDFQTTDKRSDGKVWDMYSSCTFTFVTNQDKGSHTPECTAYNREHSFPKSWFKVASGDEDTEPMGTDLFHMYPTDGYVNEKRSNYPFGEVASASYTSNGGFSKLGSCSSPGYSGTVFEPNNEYKGDFARSYFYMVTAYESVVDTWNTSNTNASPHLNGTKYPAFTTWTIDLLLKWNNQDPVSTKEINRNNAVYNIQKNRNPFIDYPILAEYIWGSRKGSPWSLTSDVNEVKADFNISQPAEADKLIINTSEQNPEYRILSLNGILVESGKLNSASEIQTNQLKAGMYFVELRSENRKAIKKFIISR